MRPTLELLFGYALLAGTLLLIVAAVRTARRGWIKDRDGVMVRREDSPVAWRTMQLFQLAQIVVLGLSGLGVLGFLKW